MRISRRTLLRAGASTGLAAALMACADPTVHSSVSNSSGAGDSSGNSSATGVSATSAAPPRTKLGMVGDSITKASAKALIAVLQQQGYTEIKIDAEVRRRIAVGDGKAQPLSGVKTLTKVIAAGLVPDVWVIALGTNDVGKYDTPDAYGLLIDQMMTLPDAKVPIFWVDVYNPIHLDATKMFNLVLRDRAAARGNATVVPWFDQASNTKIKILQSDHIHPNDKGVLVFADLVWTALA